MTAPTKKPVAGVVLQLQVASVYTSCSQVIEMNESDRGGETFDGTSFDSAADSNGNIGKENIYNGLIDPGKFSFTHFLDPTNSLHATILSAATTESLWKIVFPQSGGAACTFTSSVAKFGRDYKLGDGLKQSVDLTLTGLVTDYAAL
jgi:hypothetical protein